MRKFSAIASVATALVLALTACGSSEPATGADATAAPSAEAVLKVGVSPVPHAVILKFVKDNLAAKEGLKLEIIEFADYVQPNVQLDEGQLDANYFQHRPYLDDFNASKGTKLTFVQPVHLEPLGLYSKKITDARRAGPGRDRRPAERRHQPGPGAEAAGRQRPDHPEGGRRHRGHRARRDRQPQGPEVPAAGGRAAAPLAGGRGRGRDQRQLRAGGGLNPADDALVLEKAEGNPYSNGLVVKAGNENDPRVVKLAKLLAGPEVKQFIEQTYKGAVISATS